MEFICSKCQEKIFVDYYNDINNGKLNSVFTGLYTVVCNRCGEIVAVLTEDQIYDSIYKKDLDLSNI